MSATLFGAFLFSLLAAQPPANASAACDGKLKLTSPAKPGELREFLSWLPKHLPEGMEDPGPNPEDVYVADANNDGKPEYVVAESGGSEGDIDLFVFGRQGESFRFLGEPPKPKTITSDGPWYFHDYYNRLTKKHELLGTVCGKTYFLFDGNKQGERESYLWQGQQTVRACDPGWQKFQHRDFQVLYDAKLYSIASNNLNGFLRACASEISNDETVRILSDLAITAFHLDDRKACLNYAKEARQTSGFGTSPSKNAILHNESLCQKAKAAATDFRWLLHARGGYHEIVSGNPGFDALLSATVPDFDYKSAQYDTRARRWFAEGIKPGIGVNTIYSMSLRETVRGNLAPPEFAMSAAKDRFVTMAGCHPHSCGDKALIWVDVDKNLSAFAINDYLPPGGEKSCYAIGSRTVNEKSLPAEFWEKFRGLQNATQEQISCFLFFDGRGQQVQVREFEVPKGT